MTASLARLHIASRAARLSLEAVNRAWTHREDVLSRLHETRGAKTTAWARACRQNLWDQAARARDEHHWRRREHATAWREFVAAQAACEQVAA